MGLDNGILKIPDKNLSKIKKNMLENTNSYQPRFNQDDPARIEKYCLRSLCFSKTVSTSHMEIACTLADNALSVGRRQAHQNMHISHLRGFQVKMSMIC